jgi:hypothetical protein
MKAGSPITMDEFLMVDLVAPRWSSSIGRQLRALESGGDSPGGQLLQSPETSLVTF